VRKISKRPGYEPPSLTTWKRDNPGKRYGDIGDSDMHIRQDIRVIATKEQYFLCAYCCQAISSNNNDTMNEHVEAQCLAPARTLDFTNIVASCKTPNQCDNSHGSQPLPLTPLMDECETELLFKISGRVEGLTDRAKEAIRVLNLGDAETNNKKLIEKRKQLVHTVLFKNGVDPSDGLDDDELIASIIDDISTPSARKLDAFAPVAVNILKQWIS
jgi:uncharacterized protein (TIGR02646 family)